MSVKPILFNTEMVRAILDGTKTCTRRVVRYKYSNTEMKIKKDKYGARLIEIQKDENSDGSTYQKLLPFVEKEAPYQPGDILYVRETWHKYTKRVGNGESCHLAEFYGYKASIANSEDANEPWKPSIHMPKGAARIWLKVTDVRVERLQDITEDGTIKEGCIYDTEYNLGKSARIRGHFADVWDSTIKRSDLSTYGWGANPYVWVIEFERCEKPGKE